MKKIGLILSLLVSLLSAVACTPQKPSAEKQVVETTVGALACPDFKSSVFEKLNLTLLRSDKNLDIQVLSKAVDEVVDEKLSADLRSDFKKEIKQNLVELFNFLLIELPKEKKITDIQEHISLIAALSLGDHSTDEMAKLQVKLGPYFKKIDEASAKAKLSCDLSKTTGTVPHDQIESSKRESPSVTSNLPLPVIGARKVFSTAYQSCDSLRLNPMDINTESIDEAGALRLTLNPYGVGYRRSIINLPRLVQTHYYVKSFRVEQRSCADVTKNPMVYDYGGKPVPSENDLDFFTNGGTGGSALGIDCSAFVFSAFASAGLKYKKNEIVKPVQVLGIAARMYMEPEKNGWTCFEKPKMGLDSDLKPGDVVSSPYHVVMIEAVGTDPLGIQGISDCSKVTSKNFDFTVVQSSPEKGSIGINRFIAKDYLRHNSTFKAGFEAYAQQVCRARQEQKMIVPTAKNFSIIRHKQSDECRQPAVALNGESCSNSCSEVYN